MTTTRTIGGAAALLTVAGIVAWLALREPPSTQRETPPAPTGAAPGAVDPVNPPPRSRHASTDALDVSSPSDSPGALPPTVDLTKCDRDLDLFGTVVDADDKGVGGARIAAVTYPWRVGSDLNVRDRDAEIAGPSTRSAADGTFALRLTRGASVSLRVAAEGFASVELPNVLAGAKVRVTLRPGVRLIVALADADGKPVAGADVRLFNNTDRDGAPSINMRGVSGADGVCTFESLPPGAWVWIAPEHAKGYAGWTKIDLPAVGEKRQEITIPTGRTITGTVLDATTRNAVAGARVGMNWVLNMAVTTKADGTFELPGWTGKGVDDVHVLAEGYARESRKVGSAKRLDFELQRGYAVTGRVVGEETAPVAGALVSLIASDRAMGDQRISIAYGTTDADGRFRVTGLRVGMRHAIVVSAPGHARLRRETPVASGAADVALGDIALAAPRRVEGVVVGADGTPQPRVAVTLGAPSSQQYDENSYGRSVSGFTDDLGRFRFGDVAPGSYSVTATTGAAPETAVDVTVPPDADVLDVKVAQAATREIVVTVVDSAGEPVAGVLVDLVTRESWPSQALTDYQGVARLLVPDSGTVCLRVFQVRDTKKKLLPFQPRDLRDNETHVRLVLEIGAQITGRLTDPEGARVRDALVRFRSARGVESVVKTDDEGAFSVTVPANGTTTLAFGGELSRGSRMEDSELSARVEGIAPGADLVVRCERVARDRKMTVIVVSPQGVPVEGATVHVSPGFTSTATAKTDASGRAPLLDLPACELNVVVWVQSREFIAPSDVTAVPQGQDLRLVCRTATNITGTIVGEDGAALPSGMVNALRDGKIVGSAQVDGEGRFALLLPSDETAPVRLQLRRSTGSNPGPPEAVLDGVAPGTQGVRLVVRK